MTQAATRPPFRADHVGSLLRPAELKDAREKAKRGEFDMLDHFKFLKSVTKRTPRFCIPSPAMLHARGDRDALKKTYPDLNEFWADLYQAGCRYLQIDDTTIATMGDPKVQETFRKLGDEPKKDTEMYAEAVNAAIRRFRDDVVRTLGLPEIRERMAAMAIDPSGNTPEEYRKIIAADIRKWSAVAQAANIKAD